MHCEEINNYICQEINKENILQLLQVLHNQGVTKLDAAQTKIFNDINKQLIHIKQTAENQCHKLHAGKVPWMPKLTQVIYRILYWKGIQKWKKGGQICRTILCHRVLTGLVIFP